MSKISPTTDRLASLLMEVSRLLHKKMSCMTRDDKINPLQLHALVLIKEHEGMTMKQFADFLHITSPSATSFIERLVKLKWVKRAKDDSNRKLVRLQVTPFGNTIISTKLSEHTLAMRQSFSLLPQEDQKELVRILGHLQKALLTHS